MPGAFKQKRPNQRKPTAHAGASPTTNERKKLDAIVKAAKKKETEK